MRTLLAILIIAFASNASAEFEADKGQHYIASTLISTVAGLSFKKADFEDPYLLGATVAIWVGLVKEITDSSFDKRDLAYDALGAFTPVLLTWEF